MAPSLVAANPLACDLTARLTAGGVPVDLGYRRAGTGTPVLLLHGLGGSSTTWHYQEAHLALTHTVFAVDLPGFGRSQKALHRRLTPAHVCQLIADFIRRVVRQPVHLIGHSMGGAVAVLAASLDPSLVRSLTLVSAAGLGRDLPLLLRLLCLPGADRLTHLLGPLVVRLAERTPALRRRLTGDGDTTVLGPVLREAFRDYRRPAAVRAFTSALRAGANPRGQRRQGLLEGLRQLSVPVLVVWGRRDPVLPLDHGRRAVAAAGPRGRLAVLECGHSPMLEAAADFTAVILEFLGSLGQMHAAGA